MEAKTLEQLIAEGNGIAAGTPDHAKDGKIYDCYGRQLETVKEMEARHKEEHFWCLKLLFSVAAKDITDCITDTVMATKGDKISKEQIQQMLEIGYSPEAVYKHQTVEGKIEFPAKCEVCKTSNATESRKVNYQTIDVCSSCSERYIPEMIEHAEGELN